MVFWVHGSNHPSVHVYVGKLRLAAFLCLMATMVSAGGGERFFKQGRHAAQSGDAVMAFLYFSRARATDPTSSRFSKAAKAAGPSASQTLMSLGRYREAGAIDSRQSNRSGAATVSNDGGNGVTNVAPHSRRKRRLILAPVELAPRSGIFSFRTKGSVEECYEVVANKFGLNVIFDVGLGIDKEIRFEIDTVDFEDAIRALNEIARTITVPVMPNLFLVAEDSATNRREFEPTTTAFIQIPDAITDDEMQQISQSIQQVLDVKKLQIDTRNRQIVLRDTVHRVRLARAICRQLSRARAEVVFEIDLIAMNASNDMDFGLKFPTAFPVTNLSNMWHNQPLNSRATSVPLLGVGAGKTVFGVAIADTLLTIRRTKSSGRSLQRFQLRSADAEPATFNIGERFPIVNAKFSAVVRNKQIQDQTAAGTLRQAFPSFTFEDLGLNFTATPRVHNANEISIELEIEIQLLSGSAVNGIPILSNQSFHSAIRLRTNQTAIITGMKIFERRKSRSGWPFLSEVPLLGKLFSGHSNRFNVRELVVSVRPRVVQLPPSEIEQPLVLRYGPIARPLSAL